MGRTPRVLLVGLIAALVLAAPARATSVSTPSVTIADPSPAAGARTVYVIGFQLTSGLTDAHDIDLVFPAGTTSAGFSGSTVTDVDTGVDVGACGGFAGENLRCFLFGGRTAAAGHELRITLRGVTNPAPGSHTLTVSTSADADPVASAPYTVTAAATVSQPAVSNSAPSAAAGARTAYVIEFTLSATGGLSATANSRIGIAFPAGTTSTGYSSATVTDVTAGEDIGGCGGFAGVTLDCFLFSGRSAPAGHQIQITVLGVTNPPASGTYTLDVSTTSDPAAVTSAPFTVGPAATISTPAVSMTSPSAAQGARTVYVIDFTLSAGGGLWSGANSRIEITFPSGTGGYSTASVQDTTTGTTVGGCGGFSGLTVSCFLFSGQTVAAGHSLRVVLGGITNPAQGSHTLTVSTTSDPTPVASSPYAVGAPGAISAPAVNIASPSAAAGARTVYAIDFTLSADGGLSNSAASGITIVWPAGTSVAGYAGGSITDVATGTVVGNCGGFSGLTLNCGLFSGQSAGSGSDLRVTIRGLGNPPAGDHTLTVHTTSDTVPVASSPYTVDAAGTITTPAVTIAAPSPAAGARTVYVVDFQLSAGGALANAAGSGVRLDFPAGTAVTGYSGATMRDMTAGADVGNCGGFSGLTLLCGLFANAEIPAGHAVRISVRGITNRATAGATTMDVSTTSDPATVPSAAFTVAPAGTLASASLSTGVTTGGTVTDWVVQLATSATGGLSSAGNSGITLTFPAGTTFGGYAGATIRNLTTATTVGNCGGPSGLVIVCGLFGGASSAGGDVLEVTLRDITTPPSPGPYTATVFTTSDTTPVPAGPATAPADPQDPEPPPPPPAEPAPSPQPSPQPQPSPTPAPAPGPAEPPPPELAESVVAGPVSGRVLIKRPGGTFEALDDAANIPVGSIVDVTAGRIALTSAADGRGATQTAEFYAGMFQIRQKRARAPVTELALRGGSTAGCAKPKRARASARKRKKVIRRLWGSGRGRFRTSGRFSSATVRGTVWLTQEQCDGTLTRVRSGSVRVRDFKRRRTVTVKAGRSYLARAR